MRYLFLFLVLGVLQSCRKETPLPSSEIPDEPIDLQQGLPENPGEINGYMRIYYQTYTDSTGKVTLDAVSQTRGVTLWRPFQ